MKYKSIFIDLDDTLWAFTENARDTFEEMYHQYRFERYLEKSEYAVTSNELKNQFDIPIQLFLSCIGYQ